MGRAERVTEFALASALCVLVLALCVTTPRFATQENALTILAQSAKVLIVAVPFAMLLISRNVDFSVGATVALSSALVGSLMVDGELAWPLACALTMAAATLVGLTNGVLCAVLGLSPIVVTLGMLGFLRGLGLIIAGDSFPSGFSHDFAYLGQGRLHFLDLPIPVVIAAFLFVVAWLFYYRTRRGRHCQVIGAGPHASFLSGIPIKRLSLSLYVATALSAGLVGLITASELDSGTAQVGVEFELTVLTAVLLGGVAFDGGRGSLVGVLLGTVFVYTLANGFTLWGLSNDATRLANGIVLVAAAGLQATAVWYARRNGPGLSWRGSKDRRVLALGRSRGGVS
jgi:ribose transport system permease protein